MAVEIIRVKNLVLSVLKDVPASRDSDLVLYANCIEITENISDMSARGFLDKMNCGELIHFESVSRCRRKLQEMFPRLRGILYEKRHGHQFVILSELQQLTFFDDEELEGA